jgi:alpha-L-rhamnosidase
MLRADQRGQRQTAYRVIIASSEENLHHGRGDVWDSGKVESPESIHIGYGGRALRSRERCYWKVRVWDREGQASAWSDAAMWEMGLLDRADWTANWIAANAERRTPNAELKNEDGASAATSAADRHAAKPPEPMPLLRREFSVTKPVRRATVYICGLGHFELHLNGKKIGNELLEPGWTNYRKTCLYVTRDVTAQIARGKNAIGVMLGNGMYNVPNEPGRFAKFKASFGDPCLIAQIEIEYGDGTREVIASDASWKVTRGPIVFSSTYGGEDYDGRLEQPGWDRAGFDDSAWKSASVVSGPGGVLRGTSESAPAIRVAKVFEPVKITQAKPGVWVYDFGQNCALMPKFTVRGEAGSMVKLTPGELVGADRLVVQQWASKRGSTTFSYALAGRGEETWSPRFTYFGSRYVQVEGTDPQHIKVQAQFITSSIQERSHFECSNALFNRTAELIDWAIRSNTVSILTDCPHREKLGWLEQNHLVGPSLMYDENAAALFNKVCDDMADAQTPEGLVPDIAPEYTVFKGGFRDSPEWGSAALLVPWELYEWYGDVAVLRKHYSMMQRYVDYLSTTAKNHIVSHGLGDWYDLGPGKMGVSQLTPLPVTATAFYYRDIEVLAQTARLLGKIDDATKYETLGAEVKQAFNKNFYHADVHSYATGSQAANSIPVVFGLVPDGDEAAVVESIVKDVRAHDNGLTAGDVGYRYLLRALTIGGRSDVIFDMNSRSDRPGYGYMIAQGATSLTEAWNARPGASQDHFMLGHIMEWFYSSLGGIEQEPGSIGWTRVRIAPAMVGDVTWANTRYASIRGMIACIWKKEGSRTTIEVEIPPGVTGEVDIPSGRITESGAAPEHQRGVKFVGMEGGSSAYTVESGRYRFVSEK